MNNINNKKWWEPEYGFFGEFYLEGDNSKEGYLEKRQNLEERTRTEVVGVMNVLQIKGGEKILDCPCGYGRHSVMLANKGFDVVGSDINPIHLNKAIQQKGGQVKLQFYQENMLELKYNEEFDAVINMFYSFGFFDTDEENETVLMNFYKSLKYGGKFLMHTDVNIPRIENGKYKEDETRNLENGSQLRIIDKYNEQTKRIDGYWIIKKNNKEERKDYSVRVYTAQEFESICKKIGFKEVKIYSNWNNSPYSEDSEDMIVVAIK